MLERHRWDPVCPPATALVRPVRVDPAGLLGPTRSQANGKDWRRTSQGRFVPAEVDGSRPEQRILEQATRLTGGAVTGWASLRMQGAAFFDGLRDGGRVEVPVPLNCGPLHKIRRGPGDDLLRDMLYDDEIVVVQGVPCTVAVRATFDAMRYSRSLRDAVVSLDMAIAARLVVLRQLDEYVPAKQGWEGVQRVRDAIPLADDNSWSPQETKLRLIWTLDAGRPRPLTNRPIFDLDGNLLGYPDLLDPVAGVVGEYDGAGHRDAAQHSSDVDREARFRDHALEVFRVTGPDMTAPHRVTDRIHSAYGRATFLPPPRRTWTLDPPPWWR
jgi:hypothetical protein